MNMKGLSPGPWAIDWSRHRIVDAEGNSVEVGPNYRANMADVLDVALTEARMSIRDEMAEHEEKGMLR